MLKYLLTLAMIIPVLARAQENFSLSGILSDQANGEPLIGATVYFDSTTIGATTDVNGKFKIFAPKGKYKLIVNYIGYESFEQEVSLTGNQTLNVAMKSDIKKLKAVVVTDEGFKAVDIKTPQMGVSKIPSKKIKEIPAVLGEVDIIKSIQLLPGVTNGGEGDGSFNVRGGAGDQNLVLLDDATIFNTSHLFGFFSVFNADAVSSIELFKGAAPASYGGRASSVLNVNHKSGEDRVAVNGGIGILSSRLAVDGPMLSDKGSFMLAGRASYANLFLRAANFGSYAGFYDLNARFTYKINEKNNLFLSGYYGDDNMEIENAFKNVYGNLTGTLTWKHSFNDDLYSDLTFAYSRYRYNFQIFGQGVDWLAGVKNYKLSYDFGWLMNDKVTVDYGVSSIYHDFTPGDITPMNSESQINEMKINHKYALENGVFVNVVHELTDKISLQYGLRYSNFLRFGEETIGEYENGLPVTYNKELGIYESAEPMSEKTYSSGEMISSHGNFEPRLGISYQLNSTTSIKAGYNRMVQYLHLISNTTSVTPIDVWAPSGKYVEPQLADQYAIGFFKNFKDEKYSMELEAYYKTVDNRVDYIDGADLIGQERIETQILAGHSRAYGLEMLLKKNQGTLTGWIAYTLSKSEQQTLGGEAGGPGINNGNWYSTNYDRTHDLSVTASYKLSDKWSFGANFAFQTGRPVTYPDGQFYYNGQSIPTYSDRNANRLPFYHRMDVSATLRPQNKKDRKWSGEWVFSIYNLYNRQNAASISFGPNESTGLNEATKTSIFGIIPSVTYNFKF
ncbi:TonB-dependent receptor [Aureibacter tunicatorum]|uniref:Outer membrane cobalamin receptor n=1 Tax=Aureibacter tunicatorum TaxID=866807 RepID=A0AAE3XPC7_9BACT|nr:carboxypeptidase-like regulatory domain-containing protein [Aureibacter tunicatorum]MDR6238819.1 outer membrane cobalamin receptor [Aureibacter tunicatorum]BDD05254.1 collagen-binding protein [Aureibacter tunicatorum]